MTKTELMLEVAIAATGWGEGADFEMTELVCERTPLLRAVEEIYGVVYPTDDRVEDIVNKDDTERSKLSFKEKTDYDNKKWGTLSDAEKEESMKKSSQVEMELSKAWEKILHTLRGDTLAYLRGLLKAK